MADDVARHLVAAGTLLEADPERALAHARYARGRASRLAVVREAVGLAAYRAGEWTETIAELRAARRMGGGPGHLAVMADAERALGRPERALELARGPEARDLDQEAAIELLIVTSGARRDLNEPDAAVLSLQVPELDPRRRAPWSARLFYAYADALLAAGRHEEAVRWFLHAEDADDEGLTDAAERLAELGTEESSSAGLDAELAEQETAPGSAARLGAGEGYQAQPTAPGGGEAAGVAEHIRPAGLGGGEAAGVAKHTRPAGPGGEDAEGVAEDVRPAGQVRDVAEHPAADGRPTGHGSETGGPAEEGQPSSAAGDHAADGGSQGGQDAEIAEPAAELRVGADSAVSTGKHS